MFFTFFNNKNKTSSDASKTAPSSFDAENSADIDIISGIAAAVPVFSVINICIDIIIGIIGLLLNMLIIMRKSAPQNAKKVKPKTLVLV